MGDIGCLPLCRIIILGNKIIPNEFVYFDPILLKTQSLSMCGNTLLLEAFQH